ncbi:MAG TPA: hypothetical protein VF746_18620 [Longimicrobium sp.]|jgi:hypothetical protein
MDQDPDEQNKDRPGLGAGAGGTLGDVPPEPDADDRAPDPTRDSAVARVTPDQTRARPS